MDQRPIVIREERRNLIVSRHIIRHHQVDNVKLIRSDEFPELYLLNLPTHRHEDHYCPSKNTSKMKDIDTSYGGNNLTMKPGGNKQYSAPPPPPPPLHHHHHHHHRQVQVRLHSTDMLYTSQSLPPFLLGSVIDSDMAAKLHNGILIKNLGSN